MVRFGVCDFLRVDEMIVMNWLNLIEVNYYFINFYYNFIYVVDVFYVIVFFFIRERN